MNKIIWTYWHQGFKNAPFVVQKCTKQMQRLHPDWKIHLLDKDSVYEYASKVPVKEEKWKQLSIQHQSDLLRTQLLIEYGGLWMDPTVFCIQPLDTWLRDKMRAGFFLFYRPGRDRIISNWFIASERNCKFLKQLYDALCTYWNKYNFVNLGSKEETRIEHWSNRIINGRSLRLSQIWLTPLFTRLLRLHPYMVYHFMFYKLLRKDNYCARTFRKMPKFSADGPCQLIWSGLLNDLTQENRQFVDGKKAPLFKLKWNLEEKQIAESSNLDYLFSQ